MRANSQSTEYPFEWGSTTAYGNETREVYAGSGWDLAQVTADIQGLEPGTKYHSRLVAENDAGETEGLDRVFTTHALPPEASVDPPSVEPAPDFGKSIVVQPEGTVKVKAPGGGWGEH